MSASTQSCPDCGNINPADAERCLACGYKLDFTPDTPVPYEAQALPQTAPPAPSAKATGISGLQILSLVFGGGCLVALLLFGRACYMISTAKPDPNKPKMLSVGDRGVLSYGTSDEVAVAFSWEAYDRYSQFAVANDVTGQTQMVVAGLVGFVPSGTRVLVISNEHMFVREVRMEDGPYAGQSGWVEMETVRSNP